MRQRTRPNMSTAARRYRAGRTSRALQARQRFSDVAVAEAADLTPNVRRKSDNPISKSTIHDSPDRRPDDSATCGHHTTTALRHSQPDIAAAEQSPTPTHDAYIHIAQLARTTRMISIPRF